MRCFVPDMSQTMHGLIHSNSNKGATIKKCFSGRCQALNIIIIYNIYICFGHVISD